jgi:hypothetical protein
MAQDGTAVSAATAVPALHELDIGLTVGPDRRTEDQTVD